MQYRLSTGNLGLDEAIGGLRLGDNVVLRTSSFDAASKLYGQFVLEAIRNDTQVIYLRFDKSASLVPDSLASEHPDNFRVVNLDPASGFEPFASAIHRIIFQNGSQNFFLFDSLTSLLESWHSDLAVANFVQVTMPYLFANDAVSYFTIDTCQHSFETIYAVEDNAQVVLDVTTCDDALLAEPAKLWLRPSQKSLWRIDADGSRQVAMPRRKRLPVAKDHWEWLIEQASKALEASDEAQESILAAENIRRLLITNLVGSNGRLTDLCHEYMDLPAVLEIAKRLVGAGMVGGKSVGMLVARAILEAKPALASYLEKHDSYFLGSDLFYQYIIANGWWRMWAEQKTPTGYFSVGAQLNQRLANGSFPPAVREKFVELLQYFDSSPIIVRSSSRLEDNFGNAFAGKYDSVFCTSQGSLEERLTELEDAVRTVYASVMSDDALEYRKNRGLDQSNEQMAILVQRVSGAKYGDFFFPHAAGVANSDNIYVWDSTLDPKAGLLRLVFGLGTRAVDRTLNDYPKLVALDKPLLPVDVRDPSSHTQRYVDLLCLSSGQQTTLPLVDLQNLDIGTDWNYFLSVDQTTLTWLKQNNRRFKTTPMILDFKRLLSQTTFADVMHQMLETIEAAYQYPVDVEFTVNINSEGQLKINIVQCRPLQTRGLGAAVAMPNDVNPADIFFEQHGNFMGGNARQPLDYVVFVQPNKYLELTQQRRYAVARAIGRLNHCLADSNFLLAGPGRWGTTTPSLGVPAHFTDISNANVLMEFTYKDFRPELSQGSHFFQEIVEQGTFYVAIWDSRTRFNHELVTEKPNLLTEIAPELADLSDVVHVAHFDELVLYSDIDTQRVICCNS